MADWVNKVDLMPEWDQAKDGTLALNALAKVVADRLKEVKAPDDLSDDLQELIEDFTGMAEDESTDTEDFDEAMSRLYDLGDTILGGKWPHRKFIWINTF